MGRVVPSRRRVRRGYQTLGVAEFPITHDALLLGWEAQVFLPPRLHADCFRYIEGNLDPSIVPILLDVSEDSSVSFFPKLREDEAREKFPNAVQNW
jgi:hypothetical protein